MVFPSRPGGFGARDYRNPAQLRSSRGGGNRGGSSSGGFGNHQQQWDGSNSGGYDRFQQQSTGSGGAGSRQQDPSWWDNTN